MGTYGEKLRINILSPGRFHVCDLARELHECGNDVAFYSFVSAKRAEKFGLPKDCSKSLIGVMTPFLILSKIILKRNRFISALTVLVQDYVTAFYMRDCDVVIAMSGNYVFSLKRAKKKGALVILERGSKHILEQKRILEEIPSLRGKNPVPDINVRREIEGYDIADYIAVPSEHVVDSFVERGFSKKKLFLNSYGVDVGMFNALNVGVEMYDVIMVGNWCYQKGCDLISDALGGGSLKFLHVGAIGDLSFPEYPNFFHVDAVDQSQLVEFYNKAKVFILPSRQDGFGMVLAQALACGLPIVCTKDTGGPDILRYTGLTDWVYLMGDFSAENMLSSIRDAISFRDSVGRKKLELSELTWGAYGLRYDAFLKAVLKR